VRSCKFVPGADAQGTPTSLWLVMPIRFVAR
jgi:periplasmic protein TonB